MRTSTHLAILFIVVVAVASFKWPGMDEKEKGAVIGGTAGVVIGNAVSPGPGGTVVGGTVGAVTGGVIGNEVKQDREHGKKKSVLASEERKLNSSKPN